jgi:hypothetical protein
MTFSSAPTDSEDDAGLYGVASAAAYLGFSESWVAKLATRDRKLRYWQEFPPERRPDGTVTHGSPLVFKREWLDDYRASRRKPGRPKGSPNRRKK